MGLPLRIEPAVPPGVIVVTSPAGAALVRLKAPEDALTRLVGLGLASMRDATARLQAGGSVKAWRAEMERAITTQHTAAYLTAFSERTDTRPDPALISRARLSRAERADIKRAVAAQLQYLDGFQRDIAAGKLTPRQVAARADMYAVGVKPFYFQQRWGDWEVPDALLPGNQECLGNCTCRISISDNGDGTGTLTRTMGGAERHCTECPGLVGDHPVKRRRA